MKRLKTVLTALSMPLVACTGCESTGLSVRETNQRNVSTYVMSMYEPAGLNEMLDSSAQPAAYANNGKLVTPMRIAVAQVGEVAPHSALVERLQASKLFATVGGVPAQFSGTKTSPRYHDHHHTRDMDDKSQLREEMQKVQALARGTGMDYLLLVGGTIDQSTQSTNLSGADLTIVGAFIVPSRSIKTEAKSLAALIDLKTNQVVFTASASASNDAMASLAGREDGELNAARKARDEVLKKLTDDVIRQIESRRQ